MLSNAADISNEVSIINSTNNIIYNPQQCSFCTMSRLVGGLEAICQSFGCDMVKNL